MVLPEPNVLAVELVEGADGWLCVHADGRRREVPEALVLHEVADHDAGDYASVLRFARAVGGEVVPLRGEQHRWGDTLDVARGTGWARYAKVLAGAAGRLDVPAPDLDVLRASKWSGHEHVHVTEVAVRLAYLQVLRAVVFDLPVEGEQHAAITSDYATTVLMLANKALAAFGPVMVGGLDQLTRHSLRNVTAFTVAVLQLANEAARGTPAKACEDCGRPYFVQRGRARYRREESHRRSDVSKYCSTRCAKRVSMRNYRARERAKALTAADDGS
jgi:hypothetical protein